MAEILTDTFCPECDSRVSLRGEPFIGRKVTCAKCGAFLEVMDLSPVQLDWAYYDDDDTDEDEY